MNGKIILVVLLSGSFITAMAHAQKPPAPDAGVAPVAASGTPKPYDCDPICGPGLFCANGKCVSACNPPCPANEVCKGLGQCVPAPTCEPQCRAGYFCVAGKCVSPCNPPCGGNEICTSEGECVLTTQNQSTVWVWHDESPHWYWWTPRPYWWWEPRPIWRPAPHHYRHDGHHGGRGGHRRSR
jgi:hypothetical protein